MGNSWRVGLFIALVVLGGRTAAFAQARSSSGPANTGAATTATASSGATAARRPVNPSFNRVATTRRASASGSSRVAYGPGTSSAYGAMGQDDPLRPYSDRVREANSRSVIGSTRTPEPRVAVQPPRAAPSYNYYPTMRTGQHSNANLPQVRRHCTPSRGAVLAGGMGRGR